MENKLKAKMNETLYEAYTNDPEDAKDVAWNAFFIKVSVQDVAWNAFFIKVSVQLIICKY